MFLPGDEALVAGSHGRHHVVRVHEDVDERVGKAEERAVAAWRTERDISQGRRPLFLFPPRSYPECFYVAVTCACRRAREPVYVRFRRADGQ